MDRDGAEGNGKAISFLIATLKGISQVVFIENWLTGLFILAAITITSVELGVIAFLSAAIGTFVGQVGGGNPASVKQGLYGFNPMLTGIALVLFLESPMSWGIALFGAVITAAFTASMLDASAAARHADCNVSICHYNMAIAVSFEGSWRRST